MPIRILYAVESVFSDRDYLRLHVQGLESLGFEVLVLDLTALLYPGTAEVLAGGRTRQGSVVECPSLLSVVQALAKFRPHFIWSFTGADRSRYFQRLALRILFKLTADLIEYRARTGPFIVGDTSNARPAIKRLKRAAAAVIYLPWRVIKPDYSFITGLADLELASGQPIFVHSFDYDLFLRASSGATKSRGEPYLLFLDEDYAFHVDYAYSGVDAPVSADSYHREVNEMLASLGQSFGLRPVIQLHPRCDAEKARRYYVHEFSSEPTAEAIRGADLVVTHDSTAVQLAVLMEKPVILIETSEILKSELYHANVSNVARALNCQVLGPDAFPYDGPLPQFDVNAYQAYSNQFVKAPQSPKREGHVVLAEALTRILAGKHD